MNHYQLQIDNSPPAVGDFVDSTNGTVMTYENGGYPTLNITWSGFFDPHCSIETYYLSAGTIYGASDLMQVSVSCDRMLVTRCLTTAFPIDPL